MDDGKNDKQNNRDEWMHMVRIGTTVFVTFVLCILFFFMIFRYQGFADGWNKIISALQPIIIGLVLAYILNPVMLFLQKKNYKFFSQRIKKQETADKLSRGLAVTACVLIILGFISLLIAAIVPSLISSVTSLLSSLPSDVKTLIDTIQNGILGDSEIAAKTSEIIQSLTDYVEDFAQNKLLPEAQTYIAELTSGVISVVKGLLNFIIGIIVMVYVMAIQETLTGQSKKIIYSIFKPKTGNVIVETCQKASEIFGGFITGKIIDSIIIGIIAYIGCLILRIPSAVLVAVIVGVTNVIPVFGPFIGAIPSLIIVVLQSPLHALYLLIFIIILQQVDGNIIGPKILGSSTGLSSFWVMFAILVGGGCFGFIGMLLGVPVFAVIYYIIRRVVNHSLRKKKLPERTKEYVEMVAVNEKNNELVYKDKQ